MGKGQQCQLTLDDPLPKTSRQRSDYEWSSAQELKIMWLCSYRSKCTKTSYPEFCFPIPVITVYPPILGFMQSLPADFCHHPEDCLCYHHTSQGFYYCHHYYPSQLGINLIRSAWDCLPLIFARQLKIKGEKSSCLHCNLVKPYRIPSKGHRSCNINSSIPRDHIVPAVSHYIALHLRFDTLC